MAKNGLCEVVVILDRSGSMEAIRSDMAGGFDRFIEEQKAVPGECHVSLFQFDDQYEQVYENKPLAEVPKCVLVPRGSTALFDAVGRTLSAVGDRLAKTDEAERPEKVVCLIVTDGQENASKEFSGRKIKEMIEHQKTAYQWQFVYLGSDPTTFADAQSIGTKAVMYAATPTGVRGMYTGLSAAVSSYRVGASDSLDLPDKIDGAS